MIITLTERGTTRKRVLNLDLIPDWTYEPPEPEPEPTLEFAIAECRKVVTAGFWFEGRQVWRNEPGYESILEQYCQAWAERELPTSRERWARRQSGSLVEVPGRKIWVEESPEWIAAAIAGRA